VPEHRHSSPEIARDKIIEPISDLIFKSHYRRAVFRTVHELAGSEIGKPPQASGLGRGTCACEGDGQRGIKWLRHFQQLL
jgi:hypothetical protein